MTAEEFAALPLDGLRAELIQGEMVTMPAAFTDHGETASRLNIIVGHYVLAHRLGKTFAAETGFLIARNPDTVRAPDFAFIQASRVTPQASTASWGQVIPDLVAEVVSSSDRAGEIDQKVRMWLEAGVRLVWVLYPQAHTIFAYTPDAPVRLLRDGDTLDGGAVLPGFTTNVADIFG
jgi:Uma2 family endonuclease